MSLFITKLVSFPTNLLAIRGTELILNARLGTESVFNVSSIGMHSFTPLGCIGHSKTPVTCTC